MRRLWILALVLFLMGAACILIFFLYTGWSPWQEQEALGQSQYVGKVFRSPEDFFLANLPSLWYALKNRSIWEARMSYIEVCHESKRYQMGTAEILANRDVSFSVEKGELAVILGTSGAGKSTLLNILGGMDTCDEGEIRIDGVDIARLSPRDRITYRRHDVGFVFQFYNLIPNLTARENVELASEIVQGAMDPVQVLRDVGLGERTDNFPAQLSGGEQQRVAIARAVAKNPKILLCDEPTGALDYRTGKQVLQILQDMSRKKGATVLIVTHNAAIAPIGDRVISMHDGGVKQVEIQSAPKSIEELEW